MVRQGEPSRLRAWSVRLVGLLLLLQAAALGGMVLFYLSRFDPLGMIETAPLEALPPQVYDDLVISVLFFPIAAMAAAGALLYLFSFRLGWLLAMLTQAATLAACLFFYFELNGEPAFLYPLMVACIFLVGYLNSYEVRLAFHDRPAPAGNG